MTGEALARVLDEYAQGMESDRTDLGRQVAAEDRALAARLRAAAGDAP